MRLIDGQHPDRPLPVDRLIRPRDWAEGILTDVSHERRTKTVVDHTLDRTDLTVLARTTVTCLFAERTFPRIHGGWRALDGIARLAVAATTPHLTRSTTDGPPMILDDDVVATSVEPAAHAVALLIDLGRVDWLRAVDLMLASAGTSSPFTLQIAGLDGARWPSHWTWTDAAALFDRRGRLIDPE